MLARRPYNNSLGLSTTKSRQLSILRDFFNRLFITEGKPLNTGLTVSDDIMIRVWSVEILKLSQSVAAPKHPTRVSKHFAWEQVTLMSFERKKREFPIKANRRRPSSYTP